MKVQTMRVEGIAGDSREVEGMIDVLDCAYGIHAPISNSTRGDRVCGMSRHDDVEILMPDSTATPKFLESCNNGKSIPKVEYFVYEMHEGRREETVKMTMANVFVSSAEKISGWTNSHVIPDEWRGKGVMRVRLNYEKMDIECRKFKADGKPGGTMSAAGLAPQLKE